MSNANLKYTTSYQIQCDADATSPVITNPNEFSILNCANVIKIKSKNACENMNIYSFYNSILANNFLCGSLIIMLGIFLAFFGIKFIFVTKLVAGILGTAFILVFLIFSYINVQYSSFEFWLIIGISALVGIVVGYLLAKFDKVPIMLLGGFSGYLLSSFVYQLFLKYINTNPNVVYWLTLISCIVILAVLGYFLSNHVIVISTSWIGGYAIVRGVSLMAGGFPDERQLIDLIQNGEWTQVDAVLYLIISFR